MCGFVGVWGKARFDQTLSAFPQMLGAIRHRGPDDEGVWHDFETGVILGHRRLSILDLSAAGHQPMLSISGRFVLIFNGEIYNHNELRDELGKSAHVFEWRGHSDTETLLAAFEMWGVVETLKRAVGMFAIALWDRKERSLTLARDRFGEKPLYYGFSHESMLFGSELAAFYPCPFFEGVIDSTSVALLLQHKYIPAPKTVYENVYKLMPGEVAVFSGPKLGSATFLKYWDYSAVVAYGRANPFSGSDEELVLETQRVIQKAVSRQLISDVPIGAFLSGGVDSSTIVAVMAEISESPVKTFTIGFTEDQFDEARYAREVAAHLGTDHHEWYVTQRDALDIIPGISDIYSEPFADSSQIPTVLVSKLAKSHVSVSLSGDAGDELFCGYNRYIETDRRWGALSRVPQSIRSVVGAATANMPSVLMDSVISPLYGVLSRDSSRKNASAFLRKAGHIVSSKNLEELYLRMISDCNPEDVVNLESGALQNLFDLHGNVRVNSVEGMMEFDGLTYLPDDILCKVDRASMSVSLEGRVPLLDKDVVQFAAGIPYDMKLRAGVGKWPLKQVLYKYVPRKLIDRPKMGFGVPVGDWLRGDLREWAEDLLSVRRLNESGFFNVSFVRSAWSDHLKSVGNWHGLLWSILMYQSWVISQKK